MGADDAVGATKYLVAGSLRKGKSVSVVVGFVCVIVVDVAGSTSAHQFQARIHHLSDTSASHLSRTPTFVPRCEGCLQSWVKIPGEVRNMREPMKKRRAPITEGVHCAY